MCQFPSVTLVDAVASVALPSDAPGIPLLLTLRRQEESPWPNSPEKWDTAEVLTQATMVIGPVILNGPSGISTYPEVPSNSADRLEPPKMELVGPDCARVTPPT